MADPTYILDLSKTFNSEVDEMQLYRSVRLAQGKQTTEAALYLRLTNEDVIASCNKIPVGTALNVRLPREGEEFVGVDGLRVAGFLVESGLEHDDLSQPTGRFALTIAVTAYRLIYAQAYAEQYDRPPGYEDID